MDITQHDRLQGSRSRCCELLSIWLLLWISHSLEKKINDVFMVVNCFQFDYFCGYHTALEKLAYIRNLLWIAFNLITFVDITQHYWGWRQFLPCCELLSIWLLLWISHSSDKKQLYLVLVVNCFQFDYFCGYHTAFTRFWKPNTLLWIAFNLITFVDITQRSWISYFQC